ncbi:hypothetical protein E9993_21925 [Labilibacter sediminis]|nr:hypothetical protein E9993_21925 [Labilibacter sediminis]
MPFGFLHCMGHPKPACHLLTVRSVTSARDGTYTLWIKLCNPNRGLLKIICIFNFFQQLRVWVYCSTCRAHTI